MMHPRTLEVLLDLTRALSTSLPLEEVLRVVTDAALQLLPCDHASLRLLNETRDELLASARSGAGEPYGAPAFKPGEGVVGWVAAAGIPARIADVSEDHRFKPNPAQGFAVRSLLAVPLIAGGSVVGTLCVSSPEGGAFGEDHELVALLLANSVAPRVETARMERLAFTDPTTGALNRRGLNHRLPVEIARAQAQAHPLSVALVDLDRFKSLKFSCGAATADLVLRGFVDRMREVLPPPHILARHDGELFAALFVGLDPDAASTLGLAMRDAMQRPLQIDDQGIGIVQTISLGIAGWEPGFDPDGVLSRAEQALHDAKVQGRNRAVVWRG